MRQTIDDFAELRIGMPVIYLDEGVDRIARVEGVAWDWAVVRYLASDGEYIALISTTDQVQFEAAEEEILPVQEKLPLAEALQERLEAMKRRPHTLTVKGIGEL